MKYASHTYVLFPKSRINNSFFSTIVCLPAAATKHYATSGRTSKQTNTQGLKSSSDVHPTQHGTIVHPLGVTKRQSCTTIRVDVSKGMDAE